jgi:hypothetical protein
MLKFHIIAAVPLIAAASTGCTTTATAPAPTIPIVAVAADNVGITAGMGAQNQGANLTIGYKGIKAAVVPVQTWEGKRLSLYNGDRLHEKSFSVFALLGVDAKGGLRPAADIRQVVAVGPAAEIWAAGASGVTKPDLDAAIAAGTIQR